MELRLIVVVSALVGIACGQTSVSVNTINNRPGGMASFSCSVQPGGHVVWYKQEETGKMEFARDAQLIVSTPRYNIQSKNGAFTLTIQPTKEEDSGKYMCESSDTQGGTFKHTFQVNIGENNSATRTTAAALGTIAVALLLLL